MKEQKYGKTHVVLWNYFIFVKNLYIICIVLRIKGAITVVASIAGLNPFPVIYINSLVKNYLKRFYFAIHLLWFTSGPKQNVFNYYYYSMKITAINTAYVSATKILQHLHNTYAWFWCSAVFILGPRSVLYKQDCPFGFNKSLGKWIRIRRHSSELYCTWYYQDTFQQSGKMIKCSKILPLNLTKQWVIG
jgi:hypothetical protein